MSEALEDDELVIQPSDITVVKHEETGEVQAYVWRRSRGSDWESEARFWFILMRWDAPE